MTMPRYIHTFNMPLTGTFESDYEDFDEALDDLLPGCSPKETVHRLVEQCDCHWSLDHLEPTDQLNNPEVIQ